MLLVLWALAIILAIFIFLRILLASITVRGLDQKVILITGCDSGFGFDLALRCLRNGMHVFAACLTEEGIGELLEKKLELKLDGRLDGFRMDVRSEESVAKGVEFVRSKLAPERGLHAVVNNAGIVGNVCWDDWLLPSDYEQVWQVNTMGTIRVTQAFKRLVKMEPESRIVIMASTCGRVAMPALGPYTVSKYAVEAYGDTIRAELLLFGVKVSILEPGFFRTPLTSVERNVEMLSRVWTRTGDEVKREYGQGLYEFSLKVLLNLLDPARLNPNTGMVVDAYWHAISSAWPKRRYQVGADIKWFFLPFSFLPAEMQDIFYQIVQFIDRPPIWAKTKLANEKTAKMECQISKNTHEFIK